MANFASAFICPYFEDTNGVPMPVPVELPIEPVTQGGLLGFPTSNFWSVAHRNWMPSAWDVVGSATAGFNMVGGTPSPGPVVSPGNEPSNEAEDVGVGVQWSFSGPNQTRTLPDFSLPENPRTMINWWGVFGDGFYPIQKTTYVSSTYPVFWDENGLNSTGWYWETTFALFAEFSIYKHRWDAEYWLEQTVRVDVSFRGVPSPGAEPTGGWTMAEGTGVNFNGGGATSNNTSFDRQVCGQVGVRDDTNKDPEPNWSGMNLYGFTAFPCNLTLHIRNNHLDRPAYS